MDYKVLHKEGDLFTIYTSKEDKRIIGVHNHQNSELKTLYFDLNFNVSIDIHRSIFINGWTVCENENFDNLLICVLINDYPYYFLTDYDDDRNVSIKKLNQYIDFNYNNELIFFTGSEGGGTSIVVKLLRFMGVYFGNDCGDINNRKPHESISLKWVLECVENIKNIRNGLNLSWQLYKFQTSVTNCVKIINIKNKTAFLSNLFPNSKFVSIIRHQNNFYSTDEGKKFNEREKTELLETQRPLIEGNPMFHLDFYKFFTEFQYVNKVLKFIGHDKFITSEEEFDDLKEKINFDDRVLTDYFDN